MNKQEKETQIINKVIESINNAKEIKDHFVVTPQDGYSVYTINPDLKIVHYSVMYRNVKLIDATRLIWEALEQRKREIKEETTNSFLAS